MSSKLMPIVRFPVREGNSYVYRQGDGITEEEHGGMVVSRLISRVCPGGRLIYAALAPVLGVGLAVLTGIPVESPAFCEN